MNEQSFPPAFDQITLSFQALFSLIKDVAITLQNEIDIIVGLDSRGFLLAPHMAHAIGKPFVPIRKKGKLPGSCHSVEYKLEYGTDTFQIQQGSVKNGARVLIVDDLLATGGTMSAAVDLIQKCQGDVVQCWVLMELMDLKGRDKVGATVESLIKV